MYTCIVCVRVRYVWLSSINYHRTRSFTHTHTLLVAKIRRRLIYYAPVHLSTRKTIACAIERYTLTHVYEKTNHYNVLASIRHDTYYLVPSSLRRHVNFLSHTLNTHTHMFYLSSSLVIFFCPNREGNDTRLSCTIKTLNDTWRLFTTLLFFFIF